MAVLGTCSICGGPVMVPDTWYSIIPPIPTCQQCGAVRDNPYGPIIPMKPRRTPVTVTGTDAMWGQWIRDLAASLAKLEPQLEEGLRK